MRRARAESDKKERGLKAGFDKGIRYTGLDTVIGIFEVIFSIFLPRGDRGGIFEFSR